MSGTLAITMNGQGVIDLLGAVSGGLHPALVDQLTEASEATKEAMRANAPEGVGGEEGLKGSIDFKVDPVNLLSEVIPGVPYADAVETGSRPHRPPAGPDSALAAWAKLKGLNVYAVAANIAKYGTKANPYIARTFDEVAPVVTTGFVAGIKVFLDGLLA